MRETRDESTLDGSGTARKKIGIDVVSCLAAIAACRVTVTRISGRDATSSAAKSLKRAGSSFGNRLSSVIVWPSMYPTSRRPSTRAPQGRLFRPVATTLVPSTHIFIGFNAGECVSGLQRIDRSTGEVVSIELNESRDLTRMEIGRGPCTWGWRYLPRHATDPAAHPNITPR
jgi:hypothetical protein